MKTLATFAFLAVMVVGISGADASLRNEGRQNFYFYFGTPCAYAVPTMVSPCDPCCDGGTGLLGGRIIDGLL